MEILSAILNLISKMFVPISAYFAGKKSKENEQLKDENRKLKEYKKIDDKDIHISEVYVETNW